MVSDVEPAAASQRPAIIVWAVAAMGLVGTLMVANGLINIAGEGIYAAALIVAAIGTAVLAVAVGVLAGRPWARIVGLLVAGSIGLLTLLGLPGRDDPAVIAVSGIVIGASAFVVWALAVTGRWFAGTALPRSR